MKFSRGKKSKTRKRLSSVSNKLMPKRQLRRLERHSFLTIRNLKISNQDHSPALKRSSLSASTLLDKIGN